MMKTSEAITELRLDRIRLDGGTQSRAELNAETARDYAQAIRDGAEFPPVVVYYDGSHYWLASGFHRWHAHQQAKRKCVRARVIQGTLREAVLFSVSSNEKHGLQRTAADKRHAVELLLNDEEWSKWSAQEIARRCKVSAFLVSTMKNERREAARLAREKAEEERAAASYLESRPPMEPADPSLEDHSSENQPSSQAAGDSQATYVTKHGSTATMQTANIGGARVKPVIIETEPKELAKASAQLKRSIPKSIRQAKRLGWTWEQFTAAAWEVWQSIPVAREAG